MHEANLPEHFFRHETGRITATLTRVFGLNNIDLVEDATQDACRRALEVWRIQGVPQNPAGWLIVTARNRALDILRRERRNRSLSEEFGKLSSEEWTYAHLVEGPAEVNVVKDDQLRLMFSCVHPRLSEDAQVGIMLHYLCGFSVREIAQTYLSDFATVDKRLVRAKKVLAASGALFDVSQQDDFEERMPAIHRALYLLFNQGYHGASADLAVQPLLCREAIRLTDLLLDNPFGRTAETHALAALMFLHAARLPAKVSSAGELTTLFEQDRSLWDRSMISAGIKYLCRASVGSALSEYHIEALIAAIHGQAPSSGDTDWRKIVELYDALMRLKPSPVIALNRAVAVSQSDGPEEGLAAIAAIRDSERLQDYPFYWATQAELLSESGRLSEARMLFERAYAAARNPSEKAHLQKRLANTAAP